MDSVWSLRNTRKGKIYSDLKILGKGRGLKENPVSFHTTSTSDSYYIEGRKGEWLAQHGRVGVLSVFDSCILARPLYTSIEAKYSTRLDYLLFTTNPRVYAMLSLMFGSISSKGQMLVYMVVSIWVCEVGIQYDA